MKGGEGEVVGRIESDRKCVCVYVCVIVKRERERERKKERKQRSASASSPFSVVEKRLVQYDANA